MQNYKDLNREIQRFIKTNVAPVKLRRIVITELGYDLKVYKRVNAWLNGTSEKVNLGLIAQVCLKAGLPLSDILRKYGL